MNAKQLLDEVMSLPIEERAFVVDVLLRSLNQPESEMDKKWSIEATRRLSEFRAGRVVAVAGDEVFGRVRRRFEG